MRLCIKCKIEKNESDFSKCSASKDGLYLYCRECKGKDDKAYREKNKEKLKGKRKEYVEKYRDELNRKLREYQQSDAGRKKYREYREANQERVREWNRNFYEKHKERRTALNKEYKDSHKEQYRQYYLKNKLKRRGYGETQLSKNIIADLSERQCGQCFYCGCELTDFHIDHIIPLSKGGEHKEYNLVLSCPKCNLTKGAKDPEIFINEILNVA